MMKKKVEIFKHGSAYTPKKQDIISCPECGCTIDDYTETESDRWEHDYTVQIRTIERRCECPICGCVFCDSKRKIHKLDIDPNIIMIIVSIIFSIVSVIFMFIGWTTVGVLLLLISIISLMVGIGS